MPNPEKERNKSVLHNKLEAARQGRAQQEAGGGGSSSSSSGKKVLKKPPKVVPNFGGGVLGKE
jgi:hypothetical protein